MGVTGIFYFRVVLEQTAGQEIPEWSRLEFLEKISINSFALSDVNIASQTNIQGGVRTIQPVWVCKFLSWIKEKVDLLK